MDTAKVEPSYVLGPAYPPDQAGTVLLGSAYLDSAYQSTERLAEQFSKHLADVDYDTMVGTGLSGALVIPRVAERLGKHYAIVRKEPSTHSGNLVEGRLGRRWLFVDDFTSSGLTRQVVKNAVVTALRRRQADYGPDPEGTFSHETVYVGSYLYNWGGTYIAAGGK
jgi:hypothetical protein